MQSHVHHAHLFTSNLEAALNFYREMFGAEILADLDMAGARNVFIAIGKGRLHFYDQPPRDEGRGAIHHFSRSASRRSRLVRDVRLRFGVRSPYLRP